MKDIHQAVGEIIDERILRWIERDGVSKLLLPEQITSADCDESANPQRPRSLKHRSHELAIGLTGKAPCYIERKAFVFTPGRMVLLLGGTAHRLSQTTVKRVSNINLNRPSSVLWLLAYPFGVLAEVSRVVDGADTVEVIAPYMLMDRHISGLMGRLLEQVRPRPAGYARLGRVILMEIMERCLWAEHAAMEDMDKLFHQRRPSKSRRGKLRSEAKNPEWDRPDSETSKQFSEQVQVAMEFIHSNYQTPISLDDIADAAETNPDHLGRQFKAAIGLAPVQYLLEVRMETAKQLLLTDMKVSRVAEMVGIQDHCYFSRLFRRISGVSPRQYRRQIDQ